MSTLEKLQFDDLLTQLAEQGASDLYLSVGSPPMFKIANQLVPATEEVLTAVKIEELIFPLLAPEQKEQLSKEKALIFGYTFANGLRFKINLFYQKGNLAAELRFVPPVAKSIKDLGLPKQIEKIAELEKGLVIITGPFNAGKTTTLAAIIEHINTTKQLRIVTLEQPIEFIFTNKQSIVQQREVGRDTPSFEEGLKDCLEASLDVVVVSQIEEKQTVEKILELAEQGRLVLAVTGANSALEAILKLLSFFDEDEKKRIQDILSQVLEAVVYQKLVVNRNGEFVVVPEILLQTEAVTLSIRDNKLNQINNILRTSVRQGMISFEQSLANLVKQGEITQEEALKHVDDKEGFKRMINW